LYLDQPDIISTSHAAKALYWFANPLLYLNVDLCMIGSLSVGVAWEIPGIDKFLDLERELVDPRYFPTG
jgi:hypothetical protein